MARLPRLALADRLHHIAQMGLNGGGIVDDEEDCGFWTTSLAKLIVQFKVALHAWVLLPDRFHLLVTPHHSGTLSSLMQALARDHVRQFNRKHGRTGTLWAGRYRSSVLEPERFGLACMLMLDHLPVDSGHVDAPSEYTWSSHRNYAGLATRQGFPSLQTPPFMWQLGNTPFAREQAYQRLAEARPIRARELELQQALAGGWPLGSQQFLASLTEGGARRLTRSSPGRPRKANGQ